MSAKLRLRMAAFRFERRGFPLASGALAALAMGGLYFGAVAAPEAIQFFRLPAYFPVILASYRARSRIAGMVYAGLFGSAVLWQAAWATYARAPGADLPGALATTVLLFATALLSGGIAALFTRRDALADAAWESQSLLERASSSHRIAAFVRAEVSRDLSPDEAGLLIRNPVQARWDLVLADGAWPMTEDEPDERISLGTWLGEKNEEIIVDDLRSDIRFVSTGDLRSLLAKPLRRRDGSLLAVLVLAHSRTGRFGPDDLERLRPLIRSAETALSHAGEYAESGRRRDRLASQLATIQRAARELNETQDARAIARLTLGCALRLARARSGAIQVALPGGGTDQVFAGARIADAGTGLAAAAGLESPQRTARPADGGTDQERLSIPIRHGTRSLGGFFLEPMLVDGFDEQDEQALAALAEHAATALDNAWLFATAQAEREKSEQIIRTMGDGLVRLNREGLITAVNPAAAAMLGRAEPGLLGGTMCRALACRERQCAPQCPFARSIGERASFENKRWTLEDRCLLLAGSPLPGEDSETEGAVVLIRDVSLEEQSAAFQRELLATFAHELRGPLANLTALAEVLADEAEAGRSDTSREMVDILRAQARRLANLSQRTLDVARLDAGAWPLESRPVAVTSLARDAVQRWQGAIPARHFELAAPGGPVWALADEEAAALLLDNLLENANKYAPPGSAVTVAVEQGLAQVTVAVEDCGAPLPPAELARLFERFYRRERGDARSTYGFGLGLYIVRQLARAMGGDAWAESRNGSGNRFAFSVPSMEAEVEDSDRRG